MRDGVRTLILRPSTTGQLPTLAHLPPQALDGILDRGHREHNPRLVPRSTIGGMNIQIIGIAILIVFKVDVLQAWRIRGNVLTLDVLRLAMNVEMGLMERNENTRIMASFTPVHVE